MGAVAVFDESGNLQQTIIGGQLAAPWGVALAPAGFGPFGGDLPVGNFSFLNSEINAFDPTIGMLLGTIPVDPGSGNTPGGLWALDFGIGGMNGDPNTLYFNDGIDGETHGLFAALTVAGVPEPSTLALLGAGMLSLGALRWRRSARPRERLRKGFSATLADDIFRIMKVIREDNLCQPSIGYCLCLPSRFSPLRLIGRLELTHSSSP
jgi:hypothetical protein